MRDRQYLKKLANDKLLQTLTKLIIHNTMFRLSDLYSNIIKKPLPTDCGITCELLDPQMAKLNRLLTEAVSCFSYTLILSGHHTVDYDDKEAELTPGDIFISTPGMRVYTREVSDDYSALCLMGDEAATYDIPYARNVIAASYFPSAGYAQNKFTLTDCEAKWIEHRMREIRAYIEGEHLFKNQCLYSLYSLFILDLLNVESRLCDNSDLSGHTAELFLRFLRLVNENFAAHHDIAFYADSLAVTEIYLSRIVKRYSGRTVKNHVDRLLVMEAAYLLAVTDRPVAAIAELLHFANPASFCKFFVRHKGMSPREYRTSGPFPTGMD